MASSTPRSRRAAPAAANTGRLSMQKKNHAVCCSSGAGARHRCCYDPAGGGPSPGRWRCGWRCGRHHSRPWYCWGLRWSALLRLRSGLLPWSSPVRLRRSQLLVQQLRRAGLPRRRLPLLASDHLRLRLEAGAHSCALSRFDARSAGGVARKRGAFVAFGFSATAEGWRMDSGADRCALCVKAQGAASPRVQRHCGCIRHVEAAERAAGGDAAEAGRSSASQLAQPFALGAENQGEPLRPRQLLDRICSARHRDL